MEAIRTQPSEPDTTIEGNEIPTTYQAVTGSESPSKTENHVEQVLEFILTPTSNPKKVWEELKRTVEAEEIKISHTRPRQIMFKNICQVKKEYRKKKLKHA